MTIRPRKPLKPMNRASKLGIACHQTLSFSPVMRVIPHSAVVFWPGCALMTLEPALLEKTLAILRRVEPEMALAAACCGQPTACLFPQKNAGRKNHLAALLKARGVKRIYTACPNCLLQLRQLEDVEILPVWPLLAQCLSKDDLAKVTGDFIWHDPCPTRKDPNTQTACRRLLELSGQPVAQPAHTGQNTLCCGNIGMLHTTDPEKSARMRQIRLEELGEKTIVSGCEGCLSAFRSEGRKTLHLLELLFGESTSRGWHNRFKITQKAKR